MAVQKPMAEKGDVCPQHKVDVSKVCHKCPWWTLLRGKHPQSEEQIDRWGCAIAWLPILMIEASQASHQTGAAVESFRNEVVKANQSVAFAIASLVNGGIIGRHNDEQGQLQDRT